jgi:hypothetical protein
MRQLSILTLLLIATLSYAQTRTITGRVLYDNFSPVYEATILTSDTLRLGTTNKNGDFKVVVPLETEELQFTATGTELASTRVPMDCDNVEVILIAAGYYDYKSHRKVDRVRKDMHDELPKLHSMAVAKGVFTGRTICYERKFVHSKPKLDEIRKEQKVKEKQIKESFRELEIGDTIRIPFSGSFRHDGTDRTTLSVYPYVVDVDKFDCIVEGILVDKKSNYNLAYTVINCDLCQYKSPIYENREMSVGQVFKHDMKYFKVLTR